MDLLSVLATCSFYNSSGILFPKGTGRISFDFRLTVLPRNRNFLLASFLFFILEGIMSYHSPNICTYSFSKSLLNLYIFNSIFQISWFWGLLFYLFSIVLRPFTTSVSRLYIIYVSIHSYTFLLV